MISEDNRRDHHRMAIASPAEYRLASATAFIPCTVKNLSATGMLLITKENIKEGEQVEVHITPDNPITPPLKATLEAIRCDAGDEGMQETACKILTLF